MTHAPFLMSLQIRTFLRTISTRFEADGLHQATTIYIDYTVLNVVYPVLYAHLSVYIKL